MQHLTSSNNGVQDHETETVLKATKLLDGLSIKMIEWLSVDYPNFKERNIELIQLDLLFRNVPPFYNVIPWYILAFQCPYKVKWRKYGIKSESVS